MQFCFEMEKAKWCGEKVTGQEDGMLRTHTPWRREERQEFGTYGSPRYRWAFTSRGGQRWEIAGQNPPGLATYRSTD
jgi:hypothetical protein